MVWLAMEFAHLIPNGMVEGMKQPEQRIQIEGGIYARSVTLNKGTKIPQHTHPHSHATYCASGSALLYIDKELDRQIRAGDLVEIKGGFLHEFLIEEDGTTLVCLWPENIVDFHED